MWENQYVLEQTQKFSEKQKKSQNRETINQIWGRT